MTKKKTLVISIVILLISAVITFIVFMTEPQAQHEQATIKTDMLVDVVKVKRGDYTPTVIATGTVEAAKDITLSTQVGGEVLKISEDFIPGSFVKKGEVLLQIDPADYRNILQLRISDLRLAESELSVEMGRQDVAMKDYQLIGDDLSPENKALVLRQPQLEAAKANVEAAEAAVNQARIDLQRTTIRAPFDAHIIRRNANVGSQLAPGADLGRLVGMDEYWIVANVPVADVNWLNFPENETTGADVKVMSNNWPSGYYRKGNLFQLVGALDAQTRLARVLITIPDPLARKTDIDTLPPLMLGTFVEAQIQAREIQDVVRLSRDYLRRGEKVWVMAEGKLDVKDVDILFQDAEYAYVREGLSNNDLIVTTDLSTVVEGSGLRLEEDKTSSDTVENKNESVQE